MGWGMEGDGGIQFISGLQCILYKMCVCVCAVPRQRLAKNGEDRLIDDLATEGLPIDRWASHYTCDFPISLTNFIRKVNSGFLKPSWWISGGTPKKVVICYQSAPFTFFYSALFINKTPLKHRREASGQMLAIEIPGEFSTDKVWVQCCVVLASSLVAWSQVARSTATFFQVELHPVVQATHQFSAVQILRKWAHQLG